MSRLLNAVRLFHTLRWLRLSQWYGRVWFIFVHPALPTAVSASSRSPTGRYVAGIAKPQSFLPPESFSFLHRTYRLSEVGWDSPTIPRLWRYKLHYFDALLTADLSESDANVWISRWIRENPLDTATRGGTAWEPYPTSLRIVNWICWHRKCRATGGVGLDGFALSSLQRQAAWLYGRMEHHLLGNHLWANAKALVFAGVFLHGTESEKWLVAGTRLLRRELVEQTLPDGGHFELSPMYHAVFTEDVLDILSLGSEYPEVFPDNLGRQLRARVPGLLAFLRGLTHPDGLPGQFNDTALGEGPDLAGLVSYSARLGIEEVVESASGARITATLWSDSGYARMMAGGTIEAVVIADVGRAGPDYIPGHAHADALSFEMSLGGRRLFVNGGTSTYEASAERLRQRGTRAHNTVSVDGADSSEVWSSFRLGRRIKNIHSRIHCDSESAILVGSFLGFHVLGKPLNHERRWILGNGVLTIEDRLDGTWKTAEVRLHVAPGWSVRQVDGGMEIINDKLCVRLATSAVVSMERGNWARGFGENLPVDVISIGFTGKDCRCVIRWIELK